MADPSIAAVVHDARLTPDAARLILDVALRGEGEHEVSHTHFSILLNHQGGTRRVSRALSLATELGWLTRTPGGRGHSDRYEFSHTEFRGAKEIGNTNSGGLNGDRSTEFRGAKPPVVVGEEEVGSREEEKRAREDPEEVLSPRVMEVVRSEKLDGCRGSLADYLANRVEGDVRRWGYVHTLVSWLDGNDPSVWRLPDGTSLPPEQRTGLLASALNELLAADEGRMKRPVGDPGNLKTKLSILLRQGARNGKHGSAGADRGSDRGHGQGEARSPITVGQGKHHVE